MISGFVPQSSDEVSRTADTDTELSDDESPTGSFHRWSVKHDISHPVFSAQGLIDTPSSGRKDIVLRVCTHPDEQGIDHIDEVAEHLAATYKDLSSLLSTVHYAVEGNFYYLEPRAKAKKLVITASAYLSPAFTEQDESIRKAAIERFHELFGIEDAFERQVFTHLVESAHRCALLEHDFKVWEQSWPSEGDSVKSETLMHELLIEGQKCTHEDDRFCLEDEPGYLERSYRGLIFLFNKISESPERPVLMADLIEAGAIVGTNLCSKNVVYTVDVDLSQKNPTFLELAKNSVITNMSREPQDQFVQDMQSFIGEDLKVYSRSMAVRNLPEHVRAADNFFELKFYDMYRHYHSFYVKYVSPSKERDCQKILAQYYETVADKTKPVDIIETAIVACCEMQRRHLFVDGNGRILFFMLLPVLLYQKGLWLNSTLYDPWSLIDTIEPRKIAEDLLSLCEPRPVNPQTIDWRQGLPETEKVRLLCATGDVEGFAKAIEQRPELLLRKHTFRPRNHGLLETAVRHGQKEIVKYILANHPEAVSASELGRILDYIKPRSFDMEMIELVESELCRA